MIQTYNIENLNCANCSKKIEEAISQLDGVTSAKINLMSQKIQIDFSTENIQDILEEAQALFSKIEPGSMIVLENSDDDNSKREAEKTHQAAETNFKKTRNRIVFALVLFAIIYIATHAFPLENILNIAHPLWVEFALFLIPYLIAGYDVLWRAIKNIKAGQVFDENFLMSVATIGAFALVFFPGSDPHMAEGAAVMLFYQVGELFQSKAVEKSRTSITQLIDIAADYANLQDNGKLVQVDPKTLKPGSIIVVKAGEKVPLDGVVTNGCSTLDTSALTGEAVPINAEIGSSVASGCINLNGVLTIETTKEYSDSTVAKILDMVQNASEKKSRTESFISRFAKYYTPIVVGVAVLLAILPPLLLSGSWADWIQRALVFLVVSCPCALVISVPLSFFGGIGGASRKGILIKGSNYLENLANVKVVAFDKTGTLTNGSFSVVHIEAENGNNDELLQLAAYAENYSNHPIAKSIKDAFNSAGNNMSSKSDSELGTNAKGFFVIDESKISNVVEVSGKGISCSVDGEAILAGNSSFLIENGVVPTDVKSNKDVFAQGTILHISANNKYMGKIILSDVIKEGAAKALDDLYNTGVNKTVMLTGDIDSVASAVTSQLGISDYKAGLLPQDKVKEIELLLAETSKDFGDKAKLVFVGDGINDAPVLMRSDIGIAMGGIGSDAAIEAADVVLMDDDPKNIATAIRISKKTMSIVKQNVVFALGVKFAVLVLASIGFANLWLAVFADVGVSVIAILNAMRAMRVHK